jgi:hypothetical protein
MLVLGPERPVSIRMPMDKSRDQFVHESSTGMVLESENGQWLASSFWLGYGVHVWKLPSGQAWHHLWPEERYLRLVAGPARNEIAVASHRNLKIWSTQDWRLSRQRELPAWANTAYVLACSLDRKWIALAGKPGLLLLLEAETLQTKAQFTLPVAELVSHLAWSPDSKTLALSTLAHTYFLELPIYSKELSELGLPRLEGF